MADLTRGQMDAIQLAERISSGFSVLGCLFVIVTYLSFHAFHKPINRLVFYASWGNLLTNVATIISRSGIIAGEHTALCQTQAFIIQMFMPADSLWTLAMAFNVYLTFFHRYSASQLRAIEWKYLLFCYGIPFIPAIIFTFTSTHSRGRIFGSAVLWCWITVDWNFLRIAMFYGPVWVVLITTATIYIFVGRVVYANRKRFRDLTASMTASQASHSDPEIPASKTTEVHITTSDAAGIVQNNRPFDGNASDKFTPYNVKIESTRASHTILPSEQRRVMSSADRAAWAYLKCAMLFFIALVITWGFWNATIYIATSVPTCVALYRRFFPENKRTNSFVALHDVARRSQPSSFGSVHVGVGPQRPKKARTTSEDRESSEYEAFAKQGQSVPKVPSGVSLNRSNPKFPSSLPLNRNHR